MGGLRLIAVQTVLLLARHGDTPLCDGTMSDSDCMCNVVAPFVEAIDDIFRTPPPMTGQNRAITITGTYTTEIVTSLVTTTSSKGLFLTVYWKIKGTTTLGVDFGILSTNGESVNIGTQSIEPIGTGKSIRLGVFFGLREEMSEWSKGVSFGLDVGIKGKFAFEFLFLKGYTDTGGVERCHPIHYAPQIARDFDRDAQQRVDEFTDSRSVRRIEVPKLETAIDTAGRFLLLPVNPSCARGFAVSMYLGTGVGKIVDLNFYSTFEQSKYVTLVEYERGNGIRSRIQEAVQEQLEASFSHPLQIVDSLVAVKDLVLESSSLEMEIETLEKDLRAIDEIDS